MFCLTNLFILSLLFAPVPHVEVYYLADDWLVVKVVVAQPHHHGQEGISTEL